MLPDYARYGGRGLALAAVLAIVPWWLRREMAKEPTGTKGHPLSPRGGAPSAGLYVGLDYFPWDTDAFDRALEAAAPRLTEEARGLLGLHAKIASRDGGIPNGNPFRIIAPHLTHRRWTAIPVQEWDGAPVWRWVPIFSYLSVHAGITDYLRGLTPAALAALNAGDGRAYVSTLDTYGPVQPALAAELERL